MGKTKLFYNSLNILCIVFSCLCLFGVIFVICMNGYSYESYMDMMKQGTDNLDTCASFIIVFALPIFILWIFINALLY